MNPSLRAPLDPLACPKCGLGWCTEDMAQRCCADDPFAPIEGLELPEEPMTEHEMDNAELLDWIGKATTALEAADHAQQQVREFALERDTKALLHTTEKEAAIDRIMATGLPRTKAEAAARTDSAFQEFCKDELYLMRETAYWEAEREMQVERARFARTVVAALTNTLAAA